MRDVQGAFDAKAGFFHDVGVELGGGDVFMAEKFLDGADIGAGFEEVGGEGVAEGVGAGAFLEFGGANGGGEGALDCRLVDVMAAVGLGARIGGEVAGGEEPKPGPFERGGGIFYGEGFGEPNARKAGAAIGIVEFAGSVELGFKGGEEGWGKDGDAVFIAFAIADDDDALAEIDVFDAEAEGLEEAEAGAIKEAGDEVMDTGELAKEQVDFVAGEDFRNAFGTARSLEIGNPRGGPGGGLFGRGREGR